MSSHYRDHRQWRSVSSAGTLVSRPRARAPRGRVVGSNSCLAYEKQTRGLGTSRGCVFQPRWSRARRSSSYNVSCGKGQRSETVASAPCRCASASSPGDVRDAMTSRRLEVGWRGLRKGVAWHRGSTSERLPIRMRAQRLGLRGYRRFSSSRRMASGERGVDGRRCLGKDGEVRMQRQDSIPKGLKDLRNEWTSRLKVGGWRRWDWRLKAWRGEDDGAQTSGDFARTSRQTGTWKVVLFRQTQDNVPCSRLLGSAAEWHLDDPGPLARSKG